MAQGGRDAVSGASGGLPLCSQHLYDNRFPGPVRHGIPSVGMPAGVPAVALVRCPARYWVQARINRREGPGSRCACIAPGDPTKAPTLPFCNDVPTRGVEPRASGISLRCSSIRTRWALVGSIPFLPVSSAVTSRAAVGGRRIVRDGTYVVGAPTPGCGCSRRASSPVSPAGDAATPPAGTSATPSRP